MLFQQYIDEKTHQLRILCKTKWDYLNYSEVDKWINDNFQNDVEGKYYATKILLNIVYYTKRDLEHLLAYGLHEKIYGEIVKEAMISSGNIFLNNSVTEAKIIALKKATLFVPLLDSNKPSESGNNVIGDLVHKLDILEKQVDFHWNISEENLKVYKLLVFVDDCIGSGMQLKKFWKSEIVSKIRAICSCYGIKIYYLALVGYDESINKLKQSNQLEGIKVIVSDLLTSSNRIFSKENVIWDKENNELEKAIEYFEKMKSEKGINFLGFKKLDFGVILHDRLPNWSSPLLWRKTSSWSNLLKRKTSNL